VLLLTFLLACSAVAQLQLARIDGTATTPDDRPAVGVAVTLLGRQGNTVRSAVSAEDGKFSIVGVQPGSYSMRAAADPLRAEVRDVQVGTAIPVTITLRMSAVAAEQVLVRALLATKYTKQSKHILFVAFVVKGGHYEGAARSQSPTRS
jgi:hypothetical protein